jgi:hypothetical protein
VNETADQALAFVQAVRASGWFRSAERLANWELAGGYPWSAVGMLAGPLADWERAMNPRRLGVEEFDRMDRLRELGGAHRLPVGDGPVFAAMVLAAGLVWVVRLLHAEAVWGGGRWAPRPPFGHLPEGLVVSVGRAAQGLRSRNGYAFDYDAGFPRPGPVALADAAREAQGVVFAAERIGRNLDGREGHVTDREFELFHVFDQLEWHCARLPRGGYESCYPDRVWDDGGVSGTCAHTAVRDVWMRVSGALGGAAWAARAEAVGGEWPALPWPFPFWTPAARGCAAERFPRLNPNRWLDQLEIERTKLVAAAPGRTDRVRCDLADRSVWLDGRQLAAEVEEDAFDFFAAVAAAGKNQTRLKARLPRALKRLIKGSPAGYRLVLTR